MVQNGQNLRSLEASHFLLDVPWDDNDKGKVEESYGRISQVTNNSVLDVTSVRIGKSTAWVSD